MVDFDRLLAEARSDVIILDNEAEIGDVQRMAADHRMSTTLIDGRDVRNKHEFMHVVRTALHFPDYFGGNWDALLDMLRDMSWLPAERGHLLIFSGLSGFAETDRAEFDQALAVLHDAAEFWRERMPEKSLLIFV